MSLLAEALVLEDFGEESIPAVRAEVMLAGASGVVRAYCGWRIDQAAETLRADADGRPSVGLPTLLLSSVSAVRVDGTAVTGWSWSYSGTLRGSGLTGRVEADVVHGYGIVPDEVRAVVLALALRAHLNPASDTNHAAGGVNVRPTVELLDVERMILDRYRLPGSS